MWAVGLSTSRNEASRADRRVADIGSPFVRTRTASGAPTRASLGTALQAAVKIWGIRCRVGSRSAASVINPLTTHRRRAARGYWLTAGARRALLQAEGLD